MKWIEIIEDEQQKEYYKKLKKIIDERYQTTEVYPPKEKIFNAFSLCKYENLKVVILGQDPYHQKGQAQGLAFSTPANIKNPPSMVNILKEIVDDVGSSICLDGDLTPWAKQGVLLINTVLTVEDSLPNSHQNIGWEIFTDNIIKYISDNQQGVVFLLWGSPALKKSKLIDEKKHHILSAPHPSPLSSYRGFFGCKHFSKTNEILKRLGRSEIIW
ncbi:MAG: uracil-DNA glycosylase [Arcobacteraceae bacterium]|jgi:uracil-DNA glycosylase|nr:uracil-DNA glycosylase [Arcobacteraceae bacterium]